MMNVASSKWGEYKVGVLIYNYNMEGRQVSTSLYFQLIVFLFLPSDLHWVNPVCSKSILRSWRSVWCISHEFIQREAHRWTSTTYLCYCKWVLLLNVEERRKSMCTYKVCRVLIAYMPTLSDYLEVSRIWHQSPSLQYRSPKSPEYSEGGGGSRF